MRAWAINKKTEKGNTMKNTNAKEIKLTLKEINEDKTRAQEITRIDYNFFKLDDLDQQSFVLRTLLSTQSDAVLSTINYHLKSRIKEKAVN